MRRVALAYLLSGFSVGLAAIVLLQNGLRLSAWPAELAGILTGALLILTIALQRISSRTAGPGTEQERRKILNRKRLMFAAAAMVIVAIPLANGHFSAAARKVAPADTKNASESRRRITIGVMPKAKGDPYFISCKKGAEEAAQSLDVDLIWDGPTGLDAAQQNDVVEGWITRHVDALSVAVENGPGISSCARPARKESRW